ncbi:MAG: hypothetical protein ABW252_09875 [Polyangiales bacterium]
MIRTSTRIAFLVPVSLYVMGCGEDLGACDTTTKGRDTVLVGSVVQYGGQAILNSACANGTCHSSSATGASRFGAPAYLDFDLTPVDESEARGEDENDRGDAIVRLTNKQMVELRSRQALVLSERNTIWQQLRDGLMPPRGAFAAYRELKSIFDSSESEPCTKSKRYGNTSDGNAQEVLRNWLACGAPIVEVNASVVQKNAAIGETGFQYPMCGGGDSVDDGEPGIIVSLETLLDTGPLGYCTSCHPTASPPDLKTVAGAAMSIDSDEVVCNGKPLVTKGNPEQSFLYDVLSKDTPGCNVRRMPIGAKLPADQLRLVRDWIAAGAPRTDADIPQTEPSAPDDGTDSDATDGTDSADAGGSRGDAGARRDAGARDAGSADASTRDAGRRDAGT